MPAASNGGGVEGRMSCAGEVEADAVGVEDDEDGGESGKCDSIGGDGAGGRGRGKTSDMVCHPSLFASVSWEYSMATMGRRKAWVEDRDRQS